jgi:peroxiredoxin
MIRDLARGARAPLIAVLALAASGAAFAQETPAPRTTPPAQAPAAKAEAPKSTMAKVGEAAPDFTLKDTDGKEHKLSDLTKAGKIVVLEWFNPDCPVSAGYHSKENNVMLDLAGELRGKDVVWLAVNSGAAGKQGAGQERNAKAVKDFELSYPVLLDESGSVGRLYGAKTTPHMYVIGKDGKLAYAGGIDDKASKTNYVREAVMALAAGKPVAVKESKPFGCGVKYAD